MDKSIEEKILQKMMKLPRVMKSSLKEGAGEGHGHESEGQKKRYGQSGRGKSGGGRTGRGPGMSARGKGGPGMGGRGGRGSGGRGSGSQSMLDVIGRGIVQTAQNGVMMAKTGHEEPEGSCATEEHAGRKGHGGPKGHGESGKAPFSRERVLVILLDHPDGVRQKVLAEALEINPSSASEMIGKLESDGYVKRSVDPEDKRATLISLTELGQARAYEIQDERQERLSRLYGNLTEEEKEELLRLLEKMEGSAEEPEAAEE